MPSTEALKLGSSALMSYRAAIETTGHNIANIATPGYSRQRVRLQARFPNQQSFGYVGRGVEVGAVERIVSEFIDSQLRLAASDGERWNVLDRTYRALEGFLNELSETDLGDAFGRFFAILNDIAANVENPALRTQAFEEVKTFSDFFHSIAACIEDLRDGLDREVVQLAQRINDLTAEIAALNEHIMQAEAGGQGYMAANDLRDQRGSKLRELAEILDIKVQEDQRGGVIVLAGSRPLVYFGVQYEVAVRREDVNGRGVYRIVFSEDGTEVQVDSGTLRGVYDARDEILVNYDNWLDDFAASIIYRVNRIHSTGVGLEPYGTLRGTNRVVDPAAALSDLEFDYEAGNGLFEIGEGDLLVHIVEEAGGTETLHRIKVSPSMLLSGSPTALVETLDGLAGLDAKIDQQNRVVLEAEDGYGFYFSQDDAGVLAALGLAGLFSGYDAQTISLNPDMEGHPEYFAGAGALVSGDNANVRLLAALETEGVFLDTDLGFEAAYQAMVGSLGSDAFSAMDALQNQEAILLSLENERQEVSGVSLDEELANLIQFQRAYQGVAKFISVIDLLLETLIEM